MVAVEMWQRGTPPPRDTATPRRLTSPGGAVGPLIRRTLANGVDDETVRAAGFLNDDQITYDRTPWLHSETVHGAGTGMVDWTACGPVRAELQMRALPGMRIWSGTSKSRFLANPGDPTIGLHSMTPTSPRGNIQRYATNDGRKPVVMRHGRTDRLTQATYSGQSYSQTTRMQGAK